MSLSFSRAIKCYISNSTIWLGHLRGQKTVPWLKLGLGVGTTELLMLGDSPVLSDESEEVEEKKELPSEHEDGEYDLLRSRRRDGRGLLRTRGVLLRPRLRGVCGLRPLDEDLLRERLFFLFRA